MRILTLVLGFVVALGACAQEPAPAKYTEGKDYKVLAKPVRTITPGKIEVTEAFSYTCGHCYNFEPRIHAWEKAMPEDVALVKLPVIWRPSMQMLARIMYTGQALGMQHEVDARVFAAIHKEKNKLASEGAIAAIFEELGVDKDKFKKTFNSFGVSSKVQQADARTRNMKVTGTPQMIVDGRFTVAATKGMGHEGMLEVVDFLVAKVRAERAAK